jgi:hypothetical protein
MVILKATSIFYGYLMNIYVTFRIIREGPRPTPAPKSVRDSHYIVYS